MQFTSTYMSVSYRFGFSCLYIASVAKHAAAFKQVGYIVSWIHRRTGKHLITVVWQELLFPDGVLDSVRRGREFFCGLSFYFCLLAASRSRCLPMLISSGTRGVM